MLFRPIAYYFNISSAWRATFFLPQISFIFTSFNLFPRPESLSEARQSSAPHPRKALHSPAERCPTQTENHLIEAATFSPQPLKKVTTKAPSHTPAPTAKPKTSAAKEK